jgi:transglutaminase-like putative cysteine protease
MAGELGTLWQEFMLRREQSGKSYQTSAQEIGGWTTAFLLALLVLNLAWSISAAKWADGLEVLQVILLGGTLVGILMACSRFKGIFPILHSLITGTAWVAYWTSTLIQGDFTSQQRVYEMTYRWYVWFQNAISGGASSDNLVFTLELAFLGWWLAFAASWAVFREQRVWRAIVPIGIAMIVNAYYAGTRLTGYLLFYFLLALLLIARVNLGHYEAWWRSAGIRYTPDIRFDFLRHGMVFSLIAILIAWALPAVSGSHGLKELLRPLQQPWHTVQDEWKRMFTSLNYPTTVATSAFSKTLTLSGNRDVGDQVIMEVQMQGAERRYWRGIAYDTYTGRGWVNTDEHTLSFSATNWPELPDFEMRKLVTQTITLFVPEGDMLFAAAMPAGASLPIRAEVTLLPPNLRDFGTYEEAQRSRPVDISLMLSQEPLTEGITYTTMSMLSTVDIESLRKAGDVYPPYVTTRYLQIPETLPARVRELAEEITAGYENAYDKVVALESYLRQIEYNDHIPPPPPGADGVDYFLFDLRAGYCDYYASAMAIMARAVGIPARIASGYAQGEWIEELQAYRVRERDAHTWVEVFFPQYGWVEFEPTASQPRIERPERAPESPESNRALPPNPAPTGTPPAEDPLLRRGEDIGPLELPSAGPLTAWAGVILAAIALLIGLIISIEIRRRSAAIEPGLIERLYDRLLHWAARLGIALSPTRTPYEEASIIAAMIPEGQPYILKITETYVRQRFSRRLSTLEELKAVAQSWQNLRPTLWKRWLQRWSSILRRRGWKGS